MTDIKQIAADVNAWAQNEPNGNIAARLIALRDALEALAAQEGESVSISPEVVLSAPQKIWLQVSDEEAHIAETFPATDEGVTWCRDSVLACEVEYVRADLATPPSAAPVSMAEFEKALDDFYDAETAWAMALEGDAALQVSEALDARNAVRAEVLRLASAGVKPSVSRLTLRAEADRFSPPNAGLQPSERSERRLQGVVGPETK